MRKNISLLSILIVVLFFLGACHISAKNKNIVVVEKNYTNTKGVTVPIGSLCNAGDGYKSSETPEKRNGKKLRILLKVGKANGIKQALCDDGILFSRR